MTKDPFSLGKALFAAHMKEIAFYSAEASQLHWDALQESEKQRWQKQADAVVDALAERAVATALSTIRDETALQLFKKAEADPETGLSAETPVERLRYFCSLALDGRDWLDIEPFFDALFSSGALHKGPEA